MSTVRDFIITVGNLNDIVNLVNYFVLIAGNINSIASVVIDFISRKNE